ncbi:hypothetical protein [Streptomyces sp. NPDC059786]|uniref:hypothetical protein n=1 Tax=Streptomyces sp. NPDC059786 TaxID=3346946 RepID=UPI00366652F3
MYRVVHYHLMWAVVSAIGAVASLVAVEAVRGFDATLRLPPTNCIYLGSWALVGGLHAFFPGPLVGSRAEAKRARPLVAGTALPATRTSLARAAVWGYLPLPIVFGFVLGFFFGAGMAPFLACAMVPESLLTALRLAVRERRTGRVFWCGVATREEADEQPCEVPAEQPAEVLDTDGEDRARSRSKEGTRHPLWWSQRPSPATGPLPARRGSY